MCRLIPALLLYVLKSKNYHPIINTAMRQKYPKYSLKSMAAEIWQSSLLCENEQSLSHMHSAVWE